MTTRFLAPRSASATMPSIRSSKPSISPRASVCMTRSMRTLRSELSISSSCNSAPTSARTTPRNVTASCPETGPGVNRRAFAMAAPSGAGATGDYRAPAVRSPKPATPFQFLVLLMAGWIHRRRQLAIAYLQAENRVLRERLGTRRLRFTDAERRLVAEKAEGLGRTMLAELATLATPETILRWYRRLIAAKYDGSETRRSPGRPPTASDVTEQLLTMARESPSWGYTRLRGALRDLGFDVARSTIQRILRDNGVEPAPRRGKTLSWSTFLRAHWGAIAAAD